MNAEQFTNALGKVDDKYIVEAVAYKQRQKKKSIWVKRGVMAASFALILAGAMIMPRLLGGANHTVLPPDPSASGSLPSGNIPTNENPSVAHGGDDIPANENPTAAYHWQTAEEIYAAQNQESTSLIGGVSIPIYVAYQGALYGAVDEASVNQTRFCAVTEKVLFNASYEHTAYLVEKHPDCIALLINGYFTIYQKQFDVTFELDGITYGIVYTAVHPDSRSLGEVLLSNDSFTVYEAVFYPGEEREQTAYVVDILPKLRAEGYSFFLEDGVDYADAWWVAEPITIQ